MSTFLDNWLLRRAMSAPRGGGGGFPAEYQQVEYLQGSGSAYINTGYYPNTESEIYVRGCWTRIADDDPFFAVDAVPYNNGGFTCATTFNSSVVTVFNRAYTTEFEYVVDNIVEIHIGKTGFTYNGVTIAIRNTSAYTSMFPLHILGWDRAGTNILSGTGRIYKCEISENGVLVHDFYPCYRKSDNKPGMYDIVTETFFTNANPSGNDFTVGPNI